MFPVSETTGCGDLLNPGGLCYHLPMKFLCWVFRLEGISECVSGLWEPFTDIASGSVPFYTVCVCFIKSRELP